MTSEKHGVLRAQTDASLQAERGKTDSALARSVADADEAIRINGERTDRLLAGARAVFDADLPLRECANAAVALLLSQREQEERELTSERAGADKLLDRDRRYRQEKLSMLLVLERQATDVQLALERDAADVAVSARDDFLAQVSHDLHGLLGAQKIYLALLTKELGGGLDHQMASHLSTLQKVAAEMESLVSDLLDIAAIEMGQLAVAPRPHSAAELLAMTSAVFGPVARDRGQSLEVTAAPADANVMADATRALQVLGNLVSNAIKFSPRGGKIRVGFEASDDVVRFLVADSGPGVPAEHRARIFERCVGFRRESNGLGLGLFIARCLVEAHGGRLWLDGDETAGAVFRFTLPRDVERQRGHSRQSAS